MVFENQKQELASDLQVDQICDEFERQWQPKRQSALEPFLASVEHTFRTPKLLRQLLMVDVELRINAGLPVEKDDYHSIPGATSIAEALLDSYADQHDVDTQVEEPLQRSAHAVGDQIGPFQLLEKIGQGGMGTVWKAQQLTPIQRTVAVKVIKHDLDSKQIAARFNAERQTLAIMDHANIARIVDAGTTSLNQPYFAMEFVEGKPLTQHCNDNCLDVRQRLNLFSEICGAVQHAHQKQIIHRDLKPSNILVNESEKPTPKVIDFGLAKALQGTETQRLVQTQFGQMLGSLSYMSPEQAALGDSGIDTRSDIYSLGVILHELGWHSANPRCSRSGHVNRTNPAANSIARADAAKPLLD